MRKRHLEVNKEGFVTVYPSMDDGPKGCRVLAIISGMLKLLRKRKRKY